MSAYIGSYIYVDTMSVYDTGIIRLYNNNNNGLYYTCVLFRQIGHYAG